MCRILAERGGAGLGTDRGLLCVIDGPSAHYSRRFVAKSHSRHARQAHGTVKKGEYLKQYVERLSGEPAWAILDRVQTIVAAN
ncbi:MAG TPA: hypothetical protein VN039_02210, partial [Nitrospira sp.]|nr:hypothetical protein [Nitrospira sp.]